MITCNRGGGGGKEGGRRKGGVERERDGGERERGGGRKEGGGWWLERAREEEKGVREGEGERGERRWSLPVCPGRGQRSGRSSPSSESTSDYVRLLARDELPFTEPSFVIFLSFHFISLRFFSVSLS